MQLLGLWLWYLFPANPILVRIVQGGSRRTRHFLIRMGYVGALVALVFIGILGSEGVLTQRQTLTSLAKSGQWIFAIVAYGQVGLICLLAPLFMAGAIAAEQSGKTFNILLTTPLTNLQIVLGSLLGRLFFVLALLASGLPLFAILQIFGGVRMASVFICFGVAAFSAIMVGSVAITLAVLRIGGRKAVFVFVISIAAYLVGAYAADHQLRSILAVAKDTTTWLTPLHPLLVLESSLQRDYVPPAPDVVAKYPSIVRFYLGNPFQAFASITSLISAVLIAWSAIRVRAVGQRSEGGGTGLWSRLLKAARVGGERRRKPRDVWQNPIAWREANTRGNRYVGVLARGAFSALAVGAALVDVVLYHTGKIDSNYFMSVLWILLETELAVIVLVAIYMSAGCVSREREDFSLDLVLTTPITPKQYVWGKLRGLVSFLSLLLAAPVLSVLLVAVYTQIGWFAGWKQVQIAHVLPGGGAAGTFIICLPEAPLLIAMVLVPFVAFCVAVGMYQSINAKGVLRAVIITMFFMGLYVLFGALIGGNAAANLPFIGAVLNAPSPATAMYMFVDPWGYFRGFADEPTAGRVVLFFSALVAGAVLSFFVYTLFWTMVKDFDQSVRKLSGAPA